MREGPVEAYLKEQVNARGGSCLKMAPYEAGTPDRLVIMQNYVALVELKRPKGGVVSAVQAVRHKRLRALGIEVHLLYTKEAVAAFIARAEEVSRAKG